AAGAGLISTALRIPALSAALAVLCLLLSLLPSASALPILLTTLQTLALPLLSPGLSTLSSLIPLLLPICLLTCATATLALLLTRLPILSVTLTGLIVATAEREALNLVPQPVNAIERGRLRAAISRLAGLSSAGLLRGLMHCIVELLQPTRNLRLRPVRVGIDALAQPVRRALHQVREIVLVQAIQPVAQTGRCARLRRRYIARRVAHLPADLLQLVRHLLAIVSQAVAFLLRCRHFLLAGRAARVLLGLHRLAGRGQLLHAIRLRCLLARKLVRLTAQ